MPSPRAETNNPGKTRRSAGRRHTRPYAPNLVCASSVGSVTTSYEIRPVGHVESKRLQQFPVVPAVYGGVAPVRAVEPEQQSHRGRLAGAVRAEEPGDLTGFDGERKIVYGRPIAAAFGEVSSP
jgi:hypothetical protein